MNNALLTKIVNGHEISVFYDENTSIYDWVDPDNFENEQAMEDYLDKFRNGYMALYGIVVRRICGCCEQPSKVEDSLWGIECESAEEVVNYYLTSGYAPTCLETV